jgi:hypothetical protein
VVVYIYGGFSQFWYIFLGVVDADRTCIYYSSWLVKIDLTGGHVEVSITVNGEKVQSHSPGFDRSIYTCVWYVCI